MPTRDTEPEIPIFEEPETSPDVHSVVCPACKGEGMVLEVSEWATQHKAIAKRCGCCHGRKRLTHQEMAELHARGQGRPRP